MWNIRGLKTMSIGGATFDLFVRTAHDLIQTENKKQAILALHLGEKIRIQDVIQTCGGGACNTAVGFARLGMDAYVSCVLGSDQWGEALLKNFHAQHVRTDCTTIVEKEHSSFSIILSAGSGERVILYSPGTNDHLHDATFDRENARNMDWIYLNHIQEESCIIQDDIIDILTSNHALRMTWNPGGCQLDMGIREKHIHKLLEYTTILLLNQEEAYRFTKTEKIDDAFRTLCRAGPEIICITQGKNGVTATDGTKQYHCQTLPDTSIIDTTGAGDAFGTGVSFAIAQGWTLPDALKAGTLNATSVVGAFGAQAGLLSAKRLHTDITQKPLAIKISPL